MSAITTCSFGINVTLCELHLTIACVTTQLRSPLICLSALVVAWLCLAEPLFFLIILSISSEETRSYSRLLLWGSWPRYKEDSRWGFCSFLQLTKLPWLHRLGAQIIWVRFWAWQDSLSLTCRVPSIFLDFPALLFIFLFGVWQIWRTPFDWCLNFKL